MTKTPRARRSTAPRSAPATVDEYLSGVPPQARATFIRLRAAIRSAVPREATETISYRIPAFKHTRVIVWYGAFADHVSLFPTASVLGAFKHELSGFTTSKGTIQFPLDQPLPVALIKKIVRARVAQTPPKKARP